MKTAFKNYSLLFLSVLIVGTAITLITNAGLGATAVTSLPFVISELWEVSFGFLTALFNILWVLLQFFILGRKFPKIQWLQFIISFLLGLSVDLSNFFLSSIDPSTYLEQFLMLIIGCLVMGLGISIQLKSKSIYNPAEGIVVAITENTKYSFGTVKILFDCTLVVLSILLGLIVSGQITGIREGTIISALIIGPFTGIFQKIMNRK